MFLHRILTIFGEMSLHMYCPSIHSRSCHCVLLWWGGPTLAQSVWGWQLGPEEARPPHPALPAIPSNHSARYDKVRELLCSCAHGPILITMIRPFTEVSLSQTREVNMATLIVIVYFLIEYDLTVDILWRCIFKKKKKTEFEHLQ